jgi:hypothetical protein
MVTFGEQIFYMLEFIFRQRKIAMADIGITTPKQWVVRKNFGPILCDFPTMVILDEKKCFCTSFVEEHGIQVPCNGVIDYDLDFNKMVCTKCGKKYEIKPLAKSTQISDIASAISHQLINDNEKELNTMKVILNVTDENGNTTSKEILPKKTSSYVNTNANNYKRNKKRFKHSSFRTIIKSGDNEVDEEEEKKEEETTVVEEEETTEPPVPFIEKINEYVKNGKDIYEEFKDVFDKTKVDDNDSNKEDNSDINNVEENNPGNDNDEVDNDNNEEVDDNDIDDDDEEVDDNDIDDDDEEFDRMIDDDIKYYHDNEDEYNPVVPEGYVYKDEDDEDEYDDDDHVLVGIEEPITEDMKKNNPMTKYFETHPESK